MRYIKFGQVDQIWWTKRTTYCIPSWHYAAHPVYSQLHKCPSGNKHFRWLSNVLCGFKEQHGTCKSEPWDHDMIDDEDHVELTGIMFRKLGRGIEEQKPMVSCLTQSMIYNWETRKTSYPSLIDFLTFANLFIRGHRWKKTCTAYDLQLENFATEEEYEVRGSLNAFFYTLSDCTMFRLCSSPSSKSEANRDAPEAISKRNTGMTGKITNSVTSIPNSE